MNDGRRGLGPLVPFVAGRDFGESIDALGFRLGLDGGKKGRAKDQERSRSKASGWHPKSSVRITRSIG